MRIVHVLVHTRGVAVINDPQIWTMIAAFVGLQVYALRHFDQRIDALRQEMLARFEQVDRRFDQQAAVVNERFDQQAAVENGRFDHQDSMLDLRFGALEHRVAALEDDMKLVKMHLIPPAA